MAILVSWNQQLGRANKTPLNIMNLLAVQLKAIFRLLHLVSVWKVAHASLASFPEVRMLWRMRNRPNSRRNLSGHTSLAADMLTTTAVASCWLPAHHSIHHPTQSPCPPILSIIFTYNSETNLYYFRNIWVQNHSTYSKLVSSDFFLGRPTRA